jgi:hypothetical protein
MPNIVSGMVVVIDYDTADNGRYNPDRSRNSQMRSTRDTPPSQKKSIQTMKKPQAETSVTSSAAGQGETWNINDRRTAQRTEFQEGILSLG